MLRPVAEISSAEQARLVTPGLPLIEQAAIACDDAEFYEIMREAYPNSPWMWNELPGAPVAEHPAFIARREKNFQRYFSLPDFEPSKASVRGRLFHEASETWDFDNPGASHD
ncbi:hypothetical protein [Ferrovibrio terrae]|uniref:hypothetical protein n=1 Tax=Ferrovibrio terrae TaxID=2594003 RepID=UPI003137F285